MKFGSCTGIFAMLVTGSELYPPRDSIFISIYPLMGFILYT